MPELPPLPRSELEIVRIVWDHGEATVRQVVGALPHDRQLDFWTVQTYLRRLTDKGYLKVRREGRTNVYAPRVRPRRVVKEVVEDFVERLFDGEALPLLQHLIRERGLSQADLDELQHTLNELKERRS